MPLDLAGLLATPLPPGTKGLPGVPDGFAVQDIANQGWNLLAGDLPMPVAVLHASALGNNLTVMQDYLSAAGMCLAPHGKTTLCPQLFDRQLSAGAWGITVATLAHLRLCHVIGVNRVLIANELIGQAEIAEFARLCTEAPERDYYVLVDSLAGLKQMQAGFAAVPVAPVAKILVEIGMPDGRCGVRTAEEALAIMRTAVQLDRVQLCGVEGYEGLVVTADAVADAERVTTYLDTVVDVFHQARTEGLFADPRRILLSAGGSVYYDLVARLFSVEADIVPIVRSGCYLTHDSGFYRRLLASVDDRGLYGPGPALRPALQVWARVLSCPEPGLAILSAGKRDVSFDIDLPVPELIFRPGRDTSPRALSDYRIDKLSDQHAFLRLPDGADVAVGDLVALGISHPCTTFDKWSLLLEVDDDYRVIGGLKTFF